MLFLSDMIVLSIFACCLGSFLVCSICCVMWFRFVCCIVFFSLFLYVLCFWMFSSVGCVMLCLCSLCCFFIIRFVLVSHHAFRLGLGIFSCFSIIFLMVFCMLLKCLSVVVYSCVLFMICVISFSICGIMMCFLLLYCVVDSVGFVVCFALLIAVWNMVSVGRWSDMGGDTVPAVVGVCVSVVNVGSMSVLVLCCWSYRVGVVIVVWRLFSISVW